MTVSEKHMAEAKRVAEGSFLHGGSPIIDAIAAALAAAEREGREDERKRCTKIVLATANVMRIVGRGKIDASVANALDVASVAIANGEEDTHSVAPHPPGATEAGEADPQTPPKASPATNPSRSAISAGSDGNPSIPSPADGCAKMDCVATTDPDRPDAKSAIIGAEAGQAVTNSHASRNGGG